MVRALILNKSSRIHFKFNIWIASWTILAAIFIGPIFAVFFAATGDSGGLWSHLFETVIQRYVTNTLILMIGVALVSLLIGVSSAWAVVRYDFFCRSVFQWMLLLPAAIPA
jgi:iron(III) transport system permease protein